LAETGQSKKKAQPQIAAHAIREVVIMSLRIRQMALEKFVSDSTRKRSPRCRSVATPNWFDLGMASHWLEEVSRET
jgi:hypothetical protein